MPIIASTPEPGTRQALTLLPNRGNFLADAVARQFASRPTLRQVVAQVLHERIVKQYPPLSLDLSKTKLATPNQNGGWDLKLLMDVTLEYLANDTPLNFTVSVDERRCFLTQQVPTHLTYEANGSKEPDMGLIERVVADLADTLSVEYQDALTAYWNLPGDTGVSRWQWLGDLLASNLSNAASLLSPQHQPLRMVLDTLTRHPDRRDREALPHPDGFVHAYCLETCVIRDGATTRLLAPDLLVVQASHILLCKVSGSIESYPSMEAFTQDWGAHLTRQVLADRIIVKRYEPDGNIFDTQAALLLNHQLDELDAIRLPANHGEPVLQRLFAATTHPAPYFIDAPVPDQQHRAKIESTLPQWLLHASPRDRFAYRLETMELARLQRETAGASFLDGIENLHAFTTRTLRELIRQDHPDATCEPDDLELTFHVPVGDLGSGYLVPESMSLTELAIKNLASAPHGRLSVRDKTGKPVPGWLTADYLLGEKGLFSSTEGLISRANIGERYPQKINELLLANTAESQRREALFGEELKVRLPLQALEHSIRAQQGFTFQGYRHLKALMHTRAADRVVDDQDIVIRPLAFIRQPGAAADPVNNMFIVEPRDTGNGPHILYRPLYQDCLRQFPTRAALLQAITQPGALQDSVLSWLSDKARPIYSHNGFASPHILRFGPGDDTVVWTAPAPAQLAGDNNASEVADSLAQCLATGRLTQYLYGSNARTLVDLADRESVSNAESRWAILMEGGWLLFNAVLMPLLRGPAMVVGWMLQLTLSLKQDITGLDSDDSSTRELAWVDLLLNIGLIVLHSASREHPAIESATLEPVAELPLVLASLRRTATETAVQPTAAIEQGSVGLPSEPPAGDHTLIDFIQSNARDTSSRRLLDALRELSVVWPAPPPSPVEIGPFKGLYRIDNRWHASVSGLLFRVSIVPGFGEVFIIHPEKPLHPGFKLRTDGQGHWTLDQGLKLQGGGRDQRKSAKELAIANKRTLALAELNRIEDTLNAQIDLANPLLREVAVASLVSTRVRNQLKDLLRSLGNAPDDEALIAEHAAKMVQGARARLNLQVVLEKNRVVVDRVIEIRRDLIKAYPQMKEADGKFDAETKSITQYLQILAAYEVRTLEQASVYVASFTSERGQSLADMYEAIHDEASARVVHDFVETNFAAAEHYAQAVMAFEAALEEMTQHCKTGPAQRVKFLDANPKRKNYTRLSATLETLDALVELSLEPIPQATTPQEDYFLTLHINRKTSLYAMKDSHLELLSSEGFSVSERKEVLANLIEHYNQYIQTSRALVELDSNSVHPRYMPLLIERLDWVRNSAEAELAAVLREEEHLTPPATVVTSPPTTPRSRRVFKSRDKGTLVGDLVPAEAGSTFPTIVTRNPITEEISARFMENPDEGWVEIVEAKPTPPAPKPQARALATLRAEGNRLIDEVPAIEKSIEFQKRKLIDPQRRDELNPRDWNDMLSQQAQRIEAVASEIESNHGDKQDAMQSVQRLRQEALDIRSKAQRHCSEGYKAQRPRAENIDYLRAHGAVDIGLVHGPQPTAAQDYVTEFAVREKNSLTVLWYAHFHYSSTTSAPEAYTAAHLKRPEHRFITFKDLLAQAGTDNRKIVRDLYSPISPPLDRRLFLDLLPV